MLERLIINNWIIIALLLFDLEVELLIFLLEAFRAFTKRTCKTITVIDVTVWVMHTIHIISFIVRDVPRGSTNGRQILEGREIMVYLEESVIAILNMKANENEAKRHFMVKLVCLNLVLNGYRTIFSLDSDRIIISSCIAKVRNITMKNPVKHVTLDLHCLSTATKFSWYTKFVIQISLK